MARESVLPGLRAAVFTAVCTGLGAAAHREMTDAAIPLWALVTGGACVYATARLGARRERGLPGIAMLMGVLQIALHLLFAYAQAAAAPGSSAASTSMPGMSMSGMSMPGMSMSAGASMPMPMHGVSVPVADGGMRMGAGMLLVHCVAAVICAWWLRRGEAAVHALVRGAERWIVHHLVVTVLAVLGLVPGEKRSASRVEPIALALRAQWLLTTRALRGPPIIPSFA